jgi:hypothetical protein
MLEHDAAASHEALAGSFHDPEPKESSLPEKYRDLATNRELDPHVRAKAIVAFLRTGEPSSADVFEAFWQLDALPVDAVRDALAAWTGPLPDLDRLDSATRIAHGLPLRPLRLRTLSVTRDADVLDLGPVVEEQLRLAGKSWDGADLPPEERLDGEVEGSFAGTLERRVLADAEAPGDTPLYDVLLFAEDAGVVFAAGTATVVALIAYGKVEMRDRRARVALEKAITAPAAIASVDARPTSESVALGTGRTSAATPSEEQAVVRDKAPKRTAVKRTTKNKTGTEKKTTAANGAKRGVKKATASRAKKKTTAAANGHARAAQKASNGESSRKRNGG